MDPAWAPETILIASARPTGAGEPLNPALVMASTYRADGAVGYGREGNPTWSALEQALGDLESAHALALASGMAAITAVLDLLPVGARVVAPVVPYTLTAVRLRELHAAGRLEVQFVPTEDLDVVRAALPADLVWLETPSNPLMRITDLSATIALAHEHGARVVVDNTFATPLLQRPLDLGADIAMASGTKYIAGHSDALLGVLTTRDGELREQLRQRRSLLGLNPGTMEAWLALRGLRTMGLRVHAACANAEELARRLSTHPAVAQVLYPFLPGHPGEAIARSQMRAGGAMVSIVLHGDAERADAVCRATRLWSFATSLGGIESTLERRRRWPSESEQVPDTLIRLSVGAEAVDDLWRDLDAALRH